MLSEEKQLKVRRRVEAETAKTVDRLLSQGKEEEAYEYESSELFRFLDACEEEEKKL